MEDLDFEAPPPSPVETKAVIVGIETAEPAKMDCMIDHGAGSYWTDIQILRSDDPPMIQFRYTREEVTRTVDLPLRHVAEAFGAVVGGGKVAAIPGLDDKSAAEAAFLRWFADATQDEFTTEDNARAAFLSGWVGRPRAVVFSAASDEDARRLALSVAVSQELALLLDAVDRQGLTAVDLSGWSRLRAVGEMWWLACGFTAGDLDEWGKTVQESTAGKLTEDTSLAADADHGERRLAGAVVGKRDQVLDELERQAETQQISLAVCRSMARFYSRLAEQAEQREARSS